MATRFEGHLAGLIVVSVDHFRYELIAQLRSAASQGATTVVVNSTELCRSIRNASHSTLACCEANHVVMGARRPKIPTIDSFQQATITCSSQVRHVFCLQVSPKDGSRIALRGVHEKLRRASDFFILKLERQLTVCGLACVVRARQTGREGPRGPLGPLPAVRADPFYRYDIMLAQLPSP